MPDSPATPILLPASALLGIDAEGIRYVDRNGRECRCTYAECCTCLNATMPGVGQGRMIGFRDISAAAPWIELAAQPPLRFEFAPGAVTATLLGGRFVRRARPQGFDAFLQAVAGFGYRFGDLA